MTVKKVPGFIKTEKTYVPVSLRLRMYPLGDINCDKNSTSYGKRINLYTMTNTIATITIIATVIIIIIITIIIVVVIIIHSHKLGFLCPWEEGPNHD